MPDPERFGVVKYDKSGKAIDIVEKPKRYVSSDAVIAFYIFDSRFFKVIDTFKPSARGEIEIINIPKWYLAMGELETCRVKGSWIDAGTFDALLEANIHIAQKEGSALAKRCGV